MVLVLEIPLGSSLAQSGAPASNSKLSKDGEVPPTSKAPTGLIPGSGKEWPGTSDKDWSDFVNSAHSHHPKLTRVLMEYALISMRHRAIQIYHPFTFPIDEETDQEFHSSEGAQ